MIDWEKEFDKEFPNSFDREQVKRFNCPIPQCKNIKTFIKRMMHQKEKQLKLNEKELDKILKNFYEHMCGIDDYGCKSCLKYKQQILDLQGE